MAIPETPKALLDSLLRRATWHHLTSDLTPFASPDTLAPGSAPRVTPRGLRAWLQEEGDRADGAVLKVSKAGTHPQRRY